MVPKAISEAAVTQEGYGNDFIFDWRYCCRTAVRANPEFVLNFPRYKGASVLLARANFGCGSSREHAPWAILEYGFRAILARSYADIFYNNCFKNGLLPVTLSNEQMDELFKAGGAETKRFTRSVTVDLEQQTVTDDQGLRYSFTIDPFRRKCLLNVDWTILA